MDDHSADIARIAARVASSDGPRAQLLLLRHGRRERIAAATLQAAFAAPLTAEGRAEALVLGGMLPTTRPLRLFHSPVPRCEDTARAIAEGFAVRGGLAQVEGPRSFLGADFVRDPQGVVASISGLGLTPFVRQWFRGELPTDLVRPAREAAAALLDELLGTCLAAETLDLHVSHDLTVMALLGLAWDLADDEAAWPGYLEGVVLGRHEERLSLWYQGVERPLS